MTPFAAGVVMKRTKSRAASLEVDVVKTAAA
jgi:hypothetical protein